MTILEQLTDDMKTSMKVGNAQRTGVLRLLRSALKYDEIKLGHPLDEAESLRVLQREAKQRRDSIEAYRTAGRADLQAQEEMELTVIAAYLPAALSEDELAKVVDDVVAALGATDAKQTGQVMGAVMARVGVRADGGVVARVVRARLQA